MLHKLKLHFKNMTENPNFVKYANKRFAPLEGFFKNRKGIRWNVRMSKEGHQKKRDDLYHVEAQIRSPKKNFGAEADGETPYEAIDNVKNQLTQKITSHKEKKITRFRKGARYAKNMLRGEK
ncbi:MAG: HPF/RaiA family ribosome-associated protein [Patescibacteria group bacterium]